MTSWVGTLEEMQQKPLQVGGEGSAGLVGAAGKPARVSITRDHIRGPCAGVHFNQPCSRLPMQIRVREDQEAIIASPAVMLCLPNNCRRTKQCVADPCARRPGGHHRQPCLCDLFVGHLLLKLS